VIYGGAAECAEKIAEVVAAGCQVPILDPVFDRETQMEVLAGDVLPALRR